MNTRVQCVCMCVGCVRTHAHAGYHQTLAHSKNSIDVISIDIMLIGRQKRDHENDLSWTWQLGEQFLPCQYTVCPLAQWVPHPGILAYARVLDPNLPGKPRNNRTYFQMPAWWRHEAQALSSCLKWYLHRDQTPLLLSAVKPPPAASGPGNLAVSNVRSQTGNA